MGLRWTGKGCMILGRTVGILVTYCCGGSRGRGRELRLGGAPITRLGTFPFTAATLSPHGDTVQLLRAIQPQPFPTN